VGQIVAREGELRGRRRRRLASPSGSREGKAWGSREGRELRNSERVGNLNQTRNAFGQKKYPRQPQGKLRCRIGGGRREITAKKRPHP